MIPVSLHFTPLLVLLSDVLTTLDLRHNCFIMSDSLFKSIAESATSLINLLLPTYANFSDTGLLHLSQSKCVRTMKKFVLENDGGASAIISKGIEDGIEMSTFAVQEYLESSSIPYTANPKYTEKGLQTLLESFLVLEELHLDLPPLMKFSHVYLSPPISVKKNN